MATLLQTTNIYFKEYDQSKLNISRRVFFVVSCVTVIGRPTDTCRLKFLNQRQFEAYLFIHIADTERCHRLANTLWP